MNAPDTALEIKGAVVAAAAATSAFLGWTGVLAVIVLPIVMALDDLTGTLDTGVTFASMQAAVSLTGEKTDAACALLCLGTRHLTPDMALARTAQALEGADGAVYLKTDSLRRGHIGKGLEALVNAQAQRITFSGR